MNSQTDPWFINSSWYNVSPYVLTILLSFHLVLAELQIAISSSPDSENNEYIAGSSVSLTCDVNGGHLPLMYEWNSTCSGDCFVHSQNTGAILQDILHSVDSGNHTCYVLDYVGHSGSASIEMVVTGRP